MKRRIYTDTSVIGGCFDEEFEHPSRQLFRRFERGLDVLVLSDLSLTELGGAPERIQDFIRDFPLYNMERVEITEEARELALAYLAAEVIGKSHYVDARHIATATVERVDVLVSWNFKHIVNLDRIHGYNSINLRHGYPLIEIRSPQEVLTYDER